jgi:hypothetical protein
MLWGYVDDLMKADEDNQKKIWTWVQATYKGSLELHTPTNTLHHVPVITFAPIKRKPISIRQNRKSNDFVGNVQLKRKAFSVSVSAAAVGTFELLRTTGATLPWIQATLWKLPHKEVAWVVGVKNAIAIEKSETLSDSLGRVIVGYTMVCESIHEMVPQSLVPVPAEFAQVPDEFQI